MLTEKTALFYCSTTTVCTFLLTDVDQLKKLPVDVNRLHFSRRLTVNAFDIVDVQNCWVYHQAHEWCPTVNLYEIIYDEIDPWSINKMSMVTPNRCWHTQLLRSLPSSKCLRTTMFIIFYKKICICSKKYQFYFQLLHFNTNHEGKHWKKKFNKFCFKLTS